MNAHIEKDMLLRAEPILAKGKTIADIRDIKIEINLLDKDKKPLTSEALKKSIPKAERTEDIVEILKKYNSTYNGKYIIKYETSAKKVAKDLEIEEIEERYKQISYLSFRIDANCSGTFDKTDAEKWFDIGICSGIKEEDFNKIFPKAPEQKRKEVLEVFNKYCCVFEINTPLRASHFFAQVKQEVGESINYQNESLNYKVEDLKTGSLKFFRENYELAEKYGRKQGQKANQEMIANLAYANRNGNGDVKSGDGWNFKGKGFIQLTGRENYINAQKEIEKKLPNEKLENILENPETIIASIKMAMVSSMAFWTMKNLNKKSDIAGWDRYRVDNITNIVNSGTSSKEYRRKHFDLIKNVLNKEAK